MIEELGGTAPHNKDLWGESYFVDRMGDRVKRNYFVTEMAKVARYAVSSARDVKLLATRKKKAKLHSSIRPELGYVHQQKLEDGLVKEIKE